MTREKYESLPLSTLKALAKSRNMKGISTLRKEALIERMLEEDQKENQKNMEEPAVLKEEKKDGNCTGSESGTAGKAGGRYGAPESGNLGKRHRAPVPETAVCPPGRAQ